MGTGIQTGGKKVRKSKLKQTLSMLLTVLMVFMSMNFSVFAEELTTQQTEPEIMTNDLADPAAEDPPAEASMDTEEQQAPALLSNDLPSPVANGAAEDENDLRKAIEAAKEGDVINVGSYIELTSPLVITKAITLRGSDMFGTIITKTGDWPTNGDKSSASLIVVSGVNGAVNIENMTVTGATDIILNNTALGTAYGHGINVYRSGNVTLRNVFSTGNTGASLVVNGSTVNAQYLMTADNGWYSVNVENAETYKGVFNLSSDSVLGDAVQIQSDKGGVTVNASGYENYTYVGADNQSVQIWRNTPITSTAYTVFKNVKTLYASVTAAIQAVKDGETVYLAPGTYDESVNPFPNSSHDQEKSVNIVGAADTSAPVSGESVLTKGMYIGYDDSKTRDNTISVKGITFKNVGLTVADEKAVTIENNKFYNVADNAIAVLDQLGDKYGETTPGGSVVVKNNIIDGAGTAGINLRNPYDAEVTDNNIANVNHNGILFQLAKVSNGANYKAHSGKVIVTNNIVTNWDANNDNDGGRAVRIDTQGIDGPSPIDKVFTITGNKFTKEDYSESTEDQDIVKITGVGENTVNLTNNYWNSDSPAFDTILSVFKDAGSNKASSAQVQIYPFKKANGEDGNAPISVTNGQTTTQYATLAEAVNAAPEGATVTIKEDITVDAAAGGAIQVTRPMTITADEGKKITTKGTGAVKLFNIAAEGPAQEKQVILKGLNIELADDAATELHVIQVTTPYTRVQDCHFTGQYTAGSSNVTRAVCTNAGNQNLTVTGCTFTNIRQPGYFEGSGELSNNTVTGTKGFVITANSNYAMTGNTFGENAVDIAIIPNNQSATNYDAGKLSAENNNAVVENQIDCTLAQSGTFVVDPALATKVAGERAADYTLQKAVDGVKSADSVIKVAAGTYNLDSKLNITKPLTLEGVGTVIITKGTKDWTASGDGSDAMLVDIENTNDVTLKNLTVTGAKTIMDGEKKASGSGINIYNSTNVKLENITSTNNDACGVIVNSSTVTADSLNTSGNSWGGINVDKKTENNAALTLSGNSILSEAYPIYSERSAPDVTVDAKTAEGKPYVATKIGDITVWSISVDLANRVYTLDDTKVPTIYASIEDAAKALTGGGTIYLGESTSENSFKIGYDVTLPDNITIQGVQGDNSSVVSLDYDGSADKSGTIIAGANTQLKNITFNVAKPNRTGSSAAFSVYKTGFEMESCAVNVGPGVNENYYIFDTSTLPADATVTITNSTFDSKAKAWTVYSGDISQQKTIDGKLTFTGNTITGNFASALDQITGAYDISNNTANLTAADACLVGLSVVGSSWTNIQYKSVISGNTLTTGTNPHGTDALIRILPIRIGSKVQALPAVMQPGFVPTVENNNAGTLPVYDVNMKRIHNNLCTLRLQGALTGSAIYTTYDNTKTAGRPYVTTEAPIIGTTIGGSSKIYDNLQTAVNEVGNGGTVTIPYTQGVYTYNGDLTIRDGITVEVAQNTGGTQGKALINGQVVVDGAQGVVLNNISVEATTGDATGAILTKQGAAITVNNGSVVNNSTGTGACGIRMEGQGDSVTLNNATVKAAKYYGIGVRNTDQKVEVNDSEITGWAAIMTSNGSSQEPTDRNVKITVKNSKLYGYHASNATASEGYGTVVLQENFEKVNFTAENTYFYAGVNHTLTGVESDGLYQNALQVRSYGNTINLTNCQFEMENKEARVIHSHINAEGGEPYTETAEATDANKNTFVISGLKVINPGTTDKKMIDARTRFGGVKQDEFMFTGENDLSETNIEWNRLAPTGNTIQIGDAEELAWVAEQVNSGKDTFAGKTIELTKDIDLTGIENWTPIGIDDSQKAFTGTFDGKGYTITGLTINTDQNFVGLFGAVNGGATIKDLTIDGANIKTTRKNAGALIGGTTYSNTASLTVENISIVNSSVEALGRAGGVIGWIRDSIKPVGISGCSVDTTKISGSNDSSGEEGDKIGGIVGIALSKVIIDACSVAPTGDVTVTGMRDVGGIIGYAGVSKTQSEIKNCVVGQNATVQIEPMNPVENFVARDLNVGIGGILGTYAGENACALTGNNVSETAHIVTNVDYSTKSGIVIYNGRYFGAPRDVNGSSASLTCDTANNAEITFYGKEDADESGAVLKDIVENRAQAGNTINLAKADYTSADAITINKALTINGLDADKALVGDTAIGATGQKTGVNVNAQLVVTNSDNAVMPVSIKGISIEKATDLGRAVIEGSEGGKNVHLSFENIYCSQLTAGNANSKAGVARIISNYSSDTLIDINDSYLKMPEKYQHGIAGFGDNIKINFVNSKLDGAEPIANDYKLYTRGIILGGKNGQLNIDGSDINVAYYGLSIQNDAISTANIKNSKIKAWAPLYIFDKTNITVENSDLIGRTFAPGISDNFGVIVFEDANDSILNMTGGSVTSSFVQLTEGSAIKNEALVSFSDYTNNNKNNKVTFKSTALKVDEGANTPWMFDNSNLDNGCIVEVDSTSTTKYGNNDAYQVLDNNTNIVRNAAIDIGYAVGAIMYANVGTVDTVSIPASIKQIDDVLDMTQAKNINIQVNGDLAVNSAFTGNSGQSKLILANGADVSFNDTVKNFTTINVRNMPQDNSSVITAGTAKTDDNSFVKGNVSLKVALSENGTQRTWTTEHRTDGFDKGNGTEANPFTIATPEQLTVLAQKIEAKEKYTVLGQEKAYADAYYQLTNDIAVDTWTPIGKTNAFNGHFDGNGYSIIGNGTTSALFGITGNSAVIKKISASGSFLQMVANNGGSIDTSSAMFINSGISTMTGVNTGKIENSFTNSTKGLTANGAEGTITNSFYTADKTDLIAHTYTNEDMQKARFSIKLNGKQPIDEDVNGAWGYNSELSAYPVINTDRVNADITPLEDTVIVLSNDETVGTAKISYAGLTHVYANDRVSLESEVKNNAYAFDGWYLGDSKDAADRISRESKTSYQVTGPVTLTARFNALPTRRIMAMTFQTDRGNVQVGNGAVGTASQQDVTYGQTATIKATAKAGYKFAYWTTFSDYIANPANPVIVNTNAEWTLPLSTDAVSYVAMFEPITNHRIVFQNSNGEMLKNITVQDGEDAPENTIPGNPTMPEKIFDGWTLNGSKEIFTNEQVSAKLKNVTSDMTFVAAYHNDPQAKKYTIAIIGGTIQGESSTTIQKKYNESVTVVATPQENKNFAGWHKSTEYGPIVSYNESYSFIVSDDVTLYAVYEDKPIEVTPIALLDTNVTQLEQGSDFPDLFKLRFVAQVSVPDGYAKTECGLVYTKAAVDNPDKLSLANVDGVEIKKSVSVAQSNTGQWSVTFGKLKAEQIVSVRSYLIYTDKYGESYTVYSDIVSETVKTQ